MARSPGAEPVLARVVALATHDLRQPVHALGLQLQALRARLSSATDAALLQQMQEALLQLESQVDALLDYSRGAAGLLRPEARPLPLEALYARVRPALQPLAFDRGLALRWRGGARCVRADPWLLERVLRNLVGNAIRYTDEGGVLVAARRHAGTVRLQVWDSGAGIAEHEHARLFEPGRRGAAAEGRGGEAAGGTGLGLAIVAQMVEVMGLTLTLRSVPGRGSVFTLELPAAD